ncbi:hypothetical protein VOLCADRAFT_95607 [Volvox carteri f. nagariensis]|uniref:Uncharacterized protein n=1 Tax=Volvox carteri f. nagariensis TaxID=3068 RepID=D8U825_VOLCA|nr:uncharacterized protein VOLCADRAFT_95607 [Volvox carteri f. nagariensis]EFJ44144.1 hypothetical protein VOLCADRAFT_95607 [Volvox carteri f. nagariensis]|eukprot:XP_002954738.1 hypothetical protein VOLCADRAFT_95607 [Volvox carteri f. nagariensis]
MYDRVPEASVKDLFDYYGGVARYVLQHPSLHPDREVLALLRPLLSAIHTCNVEQVRTAIGAVGRGSEASHHLVHIVADDKFQNKRLMFATKWVADKFVKRALENEEQQLILLLKISDGGLKGMLYEPVMHAVVAMGAMIYRFVCELLQPLGLPSVAPTGNQGQAHHQGPVLVLSQGKPPTSV